MPPHLRTPVLFICLMLVVCIGARLVNSQSTALRRLTDTPEHALNLNPTISGDGRWVAFEATENLAGAQSGSGFHALRVEIESDAHVFTQFANARAPVPALSQDGARVAFASTGDLLPGNNLDGNSEIFLSEGGQLRQLTFTAAADATLRVQQGNFTPSISDDGSLLAFASNRDLTGANADANLEIFCYDITRHMLTQVTNSVGIVGSVNPKLSGDRTRLAYIRDTRSSQDEPLTARDLLLHDLRTNQARVLGAQIRGLALGPGRAISDDGARVVYASATATNTMQVFLFDGRNDATRQITALGARVTDVPLNPTISGDGSRIAFATRRNVAGLNSDGSVELYVYDLPTARFTRITSAPAQATAEVVASLDDEGARVAFNFPRVLSGPVADDDLANNSELYLAGVEARTPFANDLRITHGATFGHEPAAQKAVAPAQIAFATGHNLALTTTQLRRQADGAFPRVHANVTLSVNGRPAELLYVSPAQINFVVPPGLEPGPATFTVRNHDGYESRGALTLVPAAPGIFTETGDGTGAAIALEAATLLRTPFDPLDANNNPRRLILFTTGVRGATALVVTIHGTPAPIETIVPSSELSGLDELHIILPRTLRGAGVVPLVVRADGRDSNPTTIHIGGVRRAASLQLSPASARLGVGRTLQLTATVLDEAGVVIPGAQVAFSSSAPEVAIVDDAGLVRGLSAGALTISAASGDAVATMQLQVYPLTLVINEVLADPADGAAGDANRDGVRSAAQDEFIEIVNASARDIDLGGYQLLTRTSGGVDTLRHTFAADTILSPGTAAVVFGGAQTATFNPDDLVFGGAQVFRATSGGLSLLNGGSTVTLTDAAGALVEQMSYGDATGLVGDRDQSVTRAPDVTGEFALHAQAAASPGRVFSPGTRADGSPFHTTAPIARIVVEPPSADIEVGAQQQFSAHAYDPNGRELTGVIFRWQSSDPTVATVDAQGLASSVAVGACELTATARDVRSAPAHLSVHSPPRVLTRIVVSPATANIPPGATQQFSAQGFDQNGQEIAGLSFVWTSSDADVASIDQNGLATALGAGTTQIAAAVGPIMSAPAGLSVTLPSLPVPGQIIINEALVAFATSSTQTRNDFVELCNTTGQTLDISGLVLTFRPAGAGNTPSTVTLPGAFGSRTTLIKPHSYFLVVNGANTFGVAADFVVPNDGLSLNNTTGGIMLDLDGVKLDGLTYQSGSAAPAPPFNTYGEGALFAFTSTTTNDLIRSPDAADTDNNAADFRRNSATASVTPGAANPTLP